MKSIRLLLIPALFAVLPLAASADTWKDENGHGRHEFKEEYWDGNCKVERKQDKNGEYEEKRKCNAHRRGHRYDSFAARQEYQEEYRQGGCKVKRKQDKNGEYEEERKCRPRDGYSGHAPVYAPASAVVVEPGITIHGTIRSGD